MHRPQRSLKLYKDADLQVFIVRYKASNPHVLKMIYEFNNS